MAVYKDEKTGTWRVVYRFTDWTGTSKQTQKRGFKTKREAVAWENEQNVRMQASLNMTFGSFFELYEQDMKCRVRENTWKNKEYIINNKILPYFKDRKIADINSRDVVAWQNRLLSIKQENGKPYSATYLKTVHNQLSAIFNHAVKHYGLRVNPAMQAGVIGKKESDEMQFWTQEEYKKFSDAIMDDTNAFYAFEVLYWTGIREGELLALTPADFDLENGTLSINKSYQRIDRKDVITPPKTPKAIRKIKIPDFLCEEIKEYLQMLYGIEVNERMFRLSKNSLRNAMEKGAEKAGVKRIRIHDLRHSHISLLIELGYSAVAIADRVGHESIDITYRYAHLFPSTQDAMIESLSKIRKEEMESKHK